MWADVDDEVDPDGMTRGPVTDPTPIELVRSWEPRAMPTTPVPTIAPTPTPPPAALDSAGPARLRPTVMTTVGVLLTAITLLAGTAPAAAQSFVAAPTAAIDYTAVTTLPTVSCGSLVARTDHDLAIVTATLVKIGRAHV